MALVTASTAPRDSKIAKQETWQSRVLGILLHDLQLTTTINMSEHDRKERKTRTAFCEQQLNCKQKRVLQPICTSGVLDGMEKPGGTVGVVIISSSTSSGGPGGKGGSAEDKSSAQVLLHEVGTVESWEPCC